MLYPDKGGERFNHVEVKFFVSDRTIGLLQVWQELHNIAALLYIFVYTSPKTSMSRSPENDA